MKNLALILTVFIFLGCNNDPQSENQNISKAKKGTLYFGTDGISGVYHYYYLLSNGKVMYGCPTGGLETFDVNSFCESNPKKCGTYRKSGKTIAISWGDGSEEECELQPDGGLKIESTTLATAIPLERHLSGTYSWDINVSGASVIQTTQFMPDGNFKSSLTTGYDNNDGKWGDESESEQTGTYVIKGFTLTMKFESGKKEKHTVFAFDNEENPSMIGWDTKFLKRQNK